MSLLEEALYSRMLSVCFKAQSFVRILVAYSGGANCSRRASRSSSKVIILSLEERGNSLLCCHHHIRASPVSFDTANYSSNVVESSVSSRKALNLSTNSRSFGTPPEPL